MCCISTESQGVSQAEDCRAASQYSRPLGTTKNGALAALRGGMRASALFASPPKEPSAAQPLLIGKRMRGTVENPTTRGRAGIDCYVAMENFPGSAMPGIQAISPGPDESNRRGVSEVGFSS